MTDPQSVAGKLSKKLNESQRRWLISAEPTLERVVKHPCEEWWDNPEQLYVTADGEDFWLGTKGMCSPEGSSTFTEAWERLTPLGLSVRNLITGAE